jgi:hypothetical protein
MKPALKVRFDTQISRIESLEKSNLLEDNSNPSPQPNGVSVLTQRMSPTVPFVQEGEPISQIQPESPVTAVSPSNSGRIRKSPSIRVLDAFGREQLVDNISPKAPSKLNGPQRSKTSIRVLDAFGRGAESSDDDSFGKDELSGRITPLRHNEALVRVRQGLSDLARDLDEIDKY